PARRSRAPQGGPTSRRLGRATSGPDGRPFPPRHSPGSARGPAGPPRRPAGSPLPAPPPPCIPPSQGGYRGVAALLLRRRFGRLLSPSLPDAALLIRLACDENSLQSRHAGAPWGILGCHRV